jgi:signal transduction histidine kinase
MALVAGALAAPLAFGWVTQSTGMALILVVALFACGRYGQRPLAYLSVPIAALVVLAESFPDPDQEPAGAWGWSLNTLWVFALGAAFRHERLLRDRAAEATEARARAAHAEERLRLARDLHDVLSHSLAVVVVQAEVADAFLSSDTEHSRGAIRSIAATGRSALEETRRLVTEMRDDESTHLTDHSPGLAELPSLVSRVRSAGLPVRLQMDQIPALSNDVTSTAYRVVQESLTNVLRHAGAVPTDVNVLVDTSGLVIEVTNVEGLQTGTDHPNGHGLQGMRERVLACGGQLASGPDPLGGFSVRAVLPSGPP